MKRDQEKAHGEVGEEVRSQPRAFWRKKKREEQQLQSPKVLYIPNLPGASRKSTEAGVAGREGVRWWRLR